MFNFENQEERVLIDPPPLDQNEIENIVGTKINDLSLYQRAFTHKSALHKYKLNESFETMEFMGDSVLGFVITKMLFDKYEKKQEGFLTKARTKLVRGGTLAYIARHLNFHQWVLMDDKGIKNEWNKNEKILEDVFESFVGAIYLDLGMVHAKKFILNIFQDENIINMNNLMIDDNFKDQLMRWCQARHIELPQYVIVLHQNGIFNMSVQVNGRVIGYGSSKVKKQAEQQAAYQGLVELREINPYNFNNAS